MNDPRVDPVPPRPGLAIEAATDHVEVLVLDAHDTALAHVVENVGHGHTRRLVPLVSQALDQAGVTPADLGWVAADLGPGSFTGVRVGLATAHALALASQAVVRGASSLAALALGTRGRTGLVVPLVPAGRRDVYAGFFRADSRGVIHLAAAPRVAALATLPELAREAAGALARSGRDPAVRFVGPGVAAARAGLEAAFPGSTTPDWRVEGLSAHDLAHAALSSRGPAAGLRVEGAPATPLYVRSAQAEERVRHAALAGDPLTIRDLAEGDLPEVLAIERRVFSDAWTLAAFRGEMGTPMARARIAERSGRVAGYCIAIVSADTAHLGNIAVAPEDRRRGVARTLLDDLLGHVRAAGLEGVSLEVRVSNDAAQALYRAHGFRLCALRHRYYRDTGEDALVMGWFNPDRIEGRPTRGVAPRELGAEPSETS